jgi:DNA helicase-4
MIHILDALKNIYQENLSKKKFLILGRYNHDINKIINNNNKFKAISNEDKDYITVDKYPDIVLEYLTVHRAKGLEADIVFLINCEEGTYGFPSGVADDPLLNLILTDKDNFRHSEERRLFYVALTRAKEHIHLLINCQNTSAFIKEFNNGIIVENNRCPLCKTGLKVQRRNRRTGNMFWSCTNWKYGCSWTEN